MATARRIERTRRNLRRAILESDYVLRSALCILDEVLTGRMRLEQAVDVSLSDPSMAGGLLRRIEANRRTLEHLLEQNQHDFRVAMNRRRPVAGRRQAHRRLVLRRRRAARLVDEIGLRMQRLQHSYQSLCEMGKQMAAVGEQLSHVQQRSGPAHAAANVAVGRRIARRPSPFAADDAGNASRTPAPAGANRRH